jgi:hypothetical protein
MFRICIAALTTALILATAASPSAANQLKNDGQPTACDCSNCSAEHCESKPVARYHIENAWPTKPQDPAIKAN